MKNNAVNKFINFVKRVIKEVSVSFSVGPVKLSIEFGCSALVFFFA